MSGQPPYYRDEDVTLHLGDCLDVLPTLPDASVDAVVCDPPYEIGIGGQAWDRSGIAFNSAMWAECLRILRPGGHLLGFGHARTYHRLATAVEDAGFEIRDSLHWIYGQGYPGSKTQLKPGHEPIVLARAPFRGSESNLTSTTGLGGLRIAGCRTDTGRWPANLLLGHSPGCDATCMADCPVALTDAHSGVRTSGSGCTRTQVGNFMGNGGLGKAGDVQTTYGDTGGASRYFPVFRFESRITARIPAGTKHLTPKPLALMQWLVRLVTPPGGLILDPFAGSGTTLQAAVAEGMHAVGIEQHQPYADLTVAGLSKPIVLGLFGEAS